MKCDPIDPPEFPADRLLARKEQVMTAFNEHATPPRARPKRAWVLAGAAAAVAITGVVLVQPDAKPAYALSPNGDGTVTFTINDPTDPAGATAVLRAAHIRAIVLPGREPGTCPAGQRGTPAHVGYGAVRAAYDNVRQPGVPENAVVIRPDSIPEGTVLVISTMSLDRSRHGVLVLTELYQEPAPACFERIEYVRIATPSAS